MAAEEQLLHPAARFSLGDKYSNRDLRGAFISLSSGLGRDPDAPLLSGLGEHMGL